MAKIKGIFGKMRGKIGGTVFRGGENGETIASEYNGSPRNPRTVLQVRQRNKMNLAGMISKFTPYEAIASFGMSRRSARSAFVSMLLKSAQYTGQQSDTVFVTGIDWAGLKFGGSIDAGIIATGAYDDSTEKATITLAAPTGGYPVLGVVVMVYFNRDNTVVSGVVKKVDWENNQQSITVEIDCSGVLGGAESAGILAYAIPVIDKGEDARTAYTNILTLNDTRFQGNAARSLATMGAYATSCNPVFVGR